MSVENPTQVSRKHCPDRPIWLIGLFAILTACNGCKTGAGSQEYIADAQRAAKAGRYQQAQTLADRAVEKGASRDDHRLKNVRAVITRSKAKEAAEAGDIERAITLFRQAAELDSDEPRAARDYLRVAELLLKQQKPPNEVAPIAEKAIDLDPAFRDAYRLAGRLWDRAGRPRKAIEHYLWAFEADRSDVQIGARLGTLYRQTDQPWDAIAIFERVLTHSPDHVQGRVNLAELYAEVGRDSQAEEQYETLIDKHPKSAGILRRYAEFLKDRGDTQRAKEMLRRAREAMPGVQRRDMRELE